MAIILDGKKISKNINEDNKKNIEKYSSNGPLMVTVYDVENIGSKMYVNIKHKQAKRLGIKTREMMVSKRDNTEDLINSVKLMNADPSIDGILIQLPLPDNIDAKKVVNSIDPSKDVDGLTPTNQGLLFANSNISYITAATPEGIIRLLEAYKIDMFSKTVLVIGESSLFGRPMGSEVLNHKGTLLQAQESTPKEALDAMIKMADIIIVGVGKINFIDKQTLKKDAVIIDVGANKNDDGRVVGDVNFDNVKDKVSYITPVPGGVGPMTVASLFSNLIKLYEKK